MDIIGFLVVVAGLMLAPRLGLDEAALALLRRASMAAGNTRADLKLLFIKHALKPTQRLLMGSVVWQALLCGAVLYVIKAHRIPALNALLLNPAKIVDIQASLDVLHVLVKVLYILLGLSIAFHVFRMWRQRDSAPKYTLKPDKDNPGEKIEVLNDRSSHCGRFSFSKSLATMLSTNILLGILIIWLGASSGSSLLVVLGAVCLYTTFGILRIFASLIAWGLEGGSTALEWIAKVGGQRLLVLLPGIEEKNVHQFLPGVNLIEQEKHAATLRAIAPALMLLVAPFIAVVWLWPTLFVATTSSAFLGVTAFLGWYFSKSGGAMEVSERRYKAARLLFYAIPAIVLATALFGKLIERLWGNALHDQVLGIETFFTEVLGGRRSILVANPETWKTYLGLAILGLLLFVLFASTIGGALKKPGASTPTRHLGTLMRAFGSVMLLMAAWNVALLVATIGKRGGQQEIALPKGGVAPVAAKNLTATITPDGKGIRLSWTDVAETEDGYIVQRRVAQNTFATLTTIPVNAYVWEDRTAEAGTSYGYRVIAKNGMRESAPTNVAWATIPAFQVLKQVAPDSAADAAPTAETTEVDASSDDAKKETVPARPKRRIERSPTRVAEDAPVRERRKYGQSVEGWDDEFRAKTGQNPE